MTVGSRMLTNRLLHYLSFLLLYYLSFLLLYYLSFLNFCISESFFAFVFQNRFFLFIPC